MATTSSKLGQPAKALVTVACDVTVCAVTSATRHETFATGEPTTPALSSVEWGACCSTGTMGKRQSPDNGRGDGDWRRR